MQGLTHVHWKSNLLIPAFKVVRFTDLVADFKSHLSLCTCIDVLVKYNRAKSSNCKNMQGLTHVLEKAKLLIPAFKVGGFIVLAAVFESHCSLCTCRGLLLKLCNLSYFFVSTTLGS